MQAAPFYRARSRAQLSAVRSQSTRERAVRESERVRRVNVRERTCCLRVCLPKRGCVSVSLSVRARLFAVVALLSVANRNSSLQNRFSHVLCIFYVLPERVHLHQSLTAVAQQQQCVRLSAVMFAVVCSKLQHNMQSARERKRACAASRSMRCRLQREEQL